VVVVEAITMAIMARGWCEGEMESESVVRAWWTLVCGVQRT